MGTSDKLRPPVSARQVNDPSSAFEDHPHLHLFDTSKVWKYLIIGTFPPNTAMRDRVYINYFYGNKGFLWRIIHDLYNDKGYDFFSGSMDANLSEIKRWQNDYCVGLSDTIIKCRRKHALSSDDSDLIDIEYNYALKDYVLQHLHQIKKIIFTSTLGKNSAFATFKKIMGSDMPSDEKKFITSLPSPSGSANITFFNSHVDEMFGLTDDFYQYIASHAREHIPFFRARWELKKQKRIAGKNSNIIVPSAPKGIVKAYKLFKYREALPTDKCN